MVIQILCFKYGKMLEFGEGTPINIEEAVKYYKMAIENGNTDAMNHYGKMLENGEGIPVDKEKANKYYRMAEEKIDQNSLKK